MTEEQKQRAKENLAKAREAKKAKAAAEATKAAEATAVAKKDSTMVSDHDIEREARRIEKKTVAAFKADEMVSYTIPLEVGVDDANQKFVCSYNGVFYNLRRGEPLKVPKGFAEFMDRRLRFARESAKRVSDFTSPRGKRI